MDSLKRYDWRINAEGEEQEYQTPTGRYMHADEVLQGMAENSLRDQFAIAALTNGAFRYDPAEFWQTSEGTRRLIADRAYLWADAMLAARDGKAVSHG